MQHETTAAASFDLAAFAPPDYQGEALERLTGLSSGVSSIFEAAGFAPIEPAILQPADILFDLYGEEIWERSFIIEDVEHGAWCLRPDFTAPVARCHLTSAAAGEAARYHYAGSVFRRARGAGDGALQQQQAGVEIIGEADEVASDVEAFRIARQALDWAGCRGYQATIGDLGLVFGVLDQVTMPERWRARLKRHFRRPDHFSALLRRYSGQTADPELASRIAFLKGFSAAGAEAVAAALGKQARDEKIPHTGKRSPAEIAERFRHLAEDARSHPMPRASLELIEAATAIEGPAPEAVADFKSLGAEAKIDLSDALALYEKRLDALAAAGVDPGALRFDAVFGRDLAYYDGFVFEMRPPAQEGDPAPRALAGGGRYDMLFKALGAGAPISGVGAALKLEAILSAVADENDVAAKAAGAGSTRAKRGETS